MRINRSILTVSFLIGCRKEIKPNLPVYEPKLVLEFYLENNKTLNCLLQESINYTDTSRFKLIDNALVILRYNGLRDTLLIHFILIQSFRKYTITTVQKSFI